jgi:signal transduction histidine kinase
VRARYLQWTDGRLAQMLIATDITARRAPRSCRPQQAEKAQVTSRLITMGEMASLGGARAEPAADGHHQLLQRHGLAREGRHHRQGTLVAALEKTARQAERAGQIIHRIRAFVKRSEPQRQPARRTIVDDAVELAGIELRRRNVAIHTYVAQRLPTLHGDPILIEQVLLNLLKNAAEAIDSAQTAASRRHIELRVVPRHTPEEGGVIEFSRHRHGPRPARRSHRPPVRGLLLHQGRGPGHRPVLCRSIVESHRGRIKAQNLYNGRSTGCRFAFTLPVEPPAHEETTPGASPR